MVFNQLESSGTIAYYNLMQMGYPLKISINDFYAKLMTYLEPRHISIGINSCCKIFLMSNNILSKDFKFGATEIHVRPGKRHLIDIMMTNFQKLNNDIGVKFNSGFNAYMRRIIYIRIRFLGKREYDLFLYIFYYLRLSSIFFVFQFNF